MAVNMNEKGFIFNKKCILVAVSVFVLALVFFIFGLLITGCSTTSWSEMLTDEQVKEIGRKAIDEDGDGKADYYEIINEHYKGVDGKIKGLAAATEGTPAWPFTGGAMTIIGALLYMFTRRVKKRVEKIEENGGGS